MIVVRNDDVATFVVSDRRVRFTMHVVGGKVKIILVYEWYN